MPAALHMTELVRDVVLALRMRGLTWGKAEQSARMVALSTC
jgi:hypothetical protein